MRAVVDTGVLVSGLIRPEGTIGEVLRALRDGRFVIVYSTPIVVEIIDVLGRPPFRAKYQIQPDDVTTLINLIRLRGELVLPQITVADCPYSIDVTFQGWTRVKNIHTPLVAETFMFQQFFGRFRLAMHFTNDLLRCGRKKAGIERITGHQLGNKLLLVECRQIVRLGKFDIKEMATETFPKR